MGHLAQQSILMIKANPGWAMAVIGITAFGESFAFFSLLFPGTVILIASGGLVTAGAIPFVSTALAGIAGGIVGAALAISAIAYWARRRFRTG